MGCLTGHVFQQCCSGGQQAGQMGGVLGYTCKVCGGGVVSETRDWAREGEPRQNFLAETTGEGGRWLRHPQALGSSAKKRKNSVLIWHFLPLSMSLSYRMAWSS